MHSGAFPSRMSENKSVNMNPHDRRKELRLPVSSTTGTSTFGIHTPSQSSLIGRSPNSANANSHAAPKHTTVRQSVLAGHDNRKGHSSHEKPRERFPIGSLHSTGLLQVGPSEKYEFTSEDLIDLGEIGRGGFGTVNKMVHHLSKMSMAVKRIRSTVDETEQKRLLMDLKVVMNSNECPYIVLFYGALFKEGDCWICMELMDTSLDKFYKYVYDVMNDRIPETILGKISVATVKALNYLKDKLEIIHRDVKPSNILLDRGGNIKLCDFGISGQLVDSIARTRDAGCRPYMAPERIDPQRGKSGYDVRSDIWSLGITLIEVATGSFPYPKWESVFEQLYQVVNGEPPTLKYSQEFNFSTEFISFVDTCLIKEENQRPKYNTLLKHSFIKLSESSNVNTSRYFTDILEQMFANESAIFTTNNPA
ncbi:Dual specificity mitogen-activated protein kinase kinase [Nesidiocoris tenuis]|uniref:mitogen-activated protein kinase kinase n=2 Tax=Nesidiocoris tenuis TaxID=355587 RepID=A0ABN7B528_9HEMI|nr:Dual specificity mitogen-activated protein kinase kinase [Nesidiocoris tenuis]